MSTAYYVNKTFAVIQKLDINDSCKNIFSKIFL
jgi:hypothetical protein